jgi:GNAT superfamily N-acetyltransferase
VALTEKNPVNHRILTCPPLTEALRSEMIDTWVEVTNHGGAGIGFLPPVSADEVAPVATELFAKIDKGDAHLILTRDGRDVLSGWLAIVRNHDHTQSHWAWLKRMHVVSSAQRSGVGTILLDAALDLCRDEGLAQLYLTTDGQSGPVGFYADRGFVEVGRMPGNTLTTDGYHDEVYMVLNLGT